MILQSPTIELVETRFKIGGKDARRYSRDGHTLGLPAWEEATAGLDLENLPHTTEKTKSGGTRRCWLVFREPGNGPRVYNPNTPPEHLATFTQTFDCHWSQGKRYVGMRIQQLEKIAPMKHWDEAFGEGILIGFGKAWLPEDCYGCLCAHMKIRFGRILWDFERLLFHKERHPRWDIVTNCKTPSDYLAG